VRRHLDDGRDHDIVSRGFERSDRALGGQDGCVRDLGERLARTIVIARLDADRWADDGGWQRPL
jgi:hypothetical protein